MDTTRCTRKPRCFASTRLSRQRRLGVAFLLAMLAARVGAQAPEPEGLQFATAAGDWISVTALETDVSFRIQGLLAEVTVNQTYLNASADWLEGRYLLPLPENAAVHALTLHVGERVIEGEVREKQEARAIYAAAASSGRKAGIVEQNRSNLFRTAVANIAPGESVQVRIGYWQRVEYRDGAFSISLPLTLTPRYNNRTLPSPSTVATSLLHADSVCCADVEAAFLPASDSATMQGQGLEPIVSLHADLTAGVALSSIGSPTHDVDVIRRGDRVLVSLRDGVVRSDRDFELRWVPEAFAVPQSALFIEHSGGQTYAMAMLLPPTLKVDPLPRELLLVIDTSGSMQGQSLAQARAALLEALTRLRRGDRFNLIQFNSVTEQLFEQAVPADEAHLRVARDWISALHATGGTEMQPALTRALAGRTPGGYVRQVVFVTDAAIGNESVLIAQIEREVGDARLFPVGIGSAPNGSFLRKAADVGRGSQLLIRSPEQVAEQMATLFAKLDRPALSDVEVRWPAGAEAFPARMPDLYDGEPMLALARLPNATGTINARGWSKQGDWNNALSLARGHAVAGVARLWARSKIEALEDSLRDGANASSVRQDIIALGVDHQLVSRFTSLVAVERTPERPANAPLASVGFDNAAPADSLAFAQGGTAAPGKFALAVALMLLALALLQRRAPPAAAGAMQRGAGEIG